MRYVKLSKSEIVRLRQLHETSPKYRVRNRAQALLLSHQGYTRNQLAAMFDVRLDTISDWFNRFESDRDTDLSDLVGKVRKPLLNDMDKKS